MKKLFIAGAALILAACGSMPKQSIDQTALEGRWLIQSINGQTVVGERPAWLEFKQQRFAANAGCNSLMGSYQIKQQSLEFTQMAGTQMYCQETMEQEGNFLGLFQQSLAIKQQGQELHLVLEGKTVLQLKKAAD